MKPQSSFTKKDLVVILLCIAFLLANIAAVGQGGRKRAKEAVCLSNLLKWGEIFQAYTADNDGYFHARGVGTPASYYRIWPYVYKPYYEDPMMRFCPSADKPEHTTGPFGTWNFGFGQWNPREYPIPGEDVSTGSYGMNRYVENLQGSYASDTRFWRRAGVKGAAQVPVLMDCMYVMYWASSTDEPPRYDGDYTTPEMKWICINRHNGFINSLFLDFSARKVGLKELWTLKHSRTFNTCDIWTKCGGVQPTDWPEWMRDFKDY